MQTGWSSVMSLIKSWVASHVVEDWRRPLAFGFSFWGVVFSAVALFMSDAIYWVFEVDTNPRFWVWLSFFLLLFIAIGRFWRQSSVWFFEWTKILIILSIAIFISVLIDSPAYANADKRKESSALDVAVPFIAKWEGLRLKAYHDIAGVPTICYGHTKTVTDYDVSIGTTKTKRECFNMLRIEVREYRQNWIRYVKPYAYAVWLPSSRDAAYTSLAYNIGEQRAGKSTATRRLNAGDIYGGCVAIGWWNRAGNRVIRGLINRRSEETELCLKGR